jgi:hypothetical protein
MPKDLWKHLSVWCVIVWLLTAVNGVEAQTVTLTGAVSETVALSLAPDATNVDARVHAVSSGSTLRLTLSGNGAGSSVIRVPLIVRSNSSFKISGLFESTTAVLTELTVKDVRATGSLVSTEAIDNLQTPPEFDLSGPFVLLSGPRVSLGGTLNSPNNALQITLLIRVNSESVRGWLAQLTFSNN